MSALKNRAFTPSRRAASVIPVTAPAKRALPRKRSQAPRALVAEKGLAQISDTGEIEQAVAQAIAANPQAVADYRAGKPQALGFLTGQIMRATRGKANPGVVNEILKQQLSS